MKDFQSTVVERLSMVESEYGGIIHVPSPDSILLNLEYMDVNRLAHATHYFQSQGVSNIISLNVDYVRDYTQDFFDEIIPHELAHIICFNNNISGPHHGDTWRELCMHMGGSGEEFVSISWK